MKDKKKNFLNSELFFDETSKEKAKYHVLPIPLEKTVSCGRGTAKGPEAIIDASNELERFTGISEPCTNGIFTYPFLNCNFAIESVMLNIEKTTKEISKQNKDFWLNTNLGVTLDNHFGVVDMLEEYEEEVQQEVLAEPPDVLHEI